MWGTGLSCASRGSWQLADNVGDTVPPDTGGGCCCCHSEGEVWAPEGPSSPRTLALYSASSHMPPSVPPCCLSGEHLGQGQSCPLECLVPSHPPGGTISSKPMTGPSASPPTSGWLLPVRLTLGKDLMSVKSAVRNLPPCPSWDTKPGLQGAHGLFKSQPTMSLRY